MATVTQSFPIEWRCRQCRFEQWVRVNATGSGTATFDDPSDSVSRNIAQSAAQQTAWRAARMKLALRPCPKCGAIDRRTAAAGVARAFVVGSLTASVPVGYELLQLEFPAWTPLALLICPAVGALVTVWLWFFRWQPGGRDLVPLE